MKAQVVITLIADDGKKHVRLVNVPVLKEVEKSSPELRDEWILAHALPELTHGELTVQHSLPELLVKKDEAEDA